MVEQGYRDPTADDLAEHVNGDSDDLHSNPEVNAYLQNWANAAGLRHLVGGLAREEPVLEGGPNWVMFLSEDAQIEAGVKLGMNYPVLSIDAHLLSTEDSGPTEEQVKAWIDRQPKPALGRLSVGGRERDDGHIEYMPRLSVDVHVDSILAEFIRELILPFAEAWDSRAVATVGGRDLGGGDGDGGVYRFRPTDVEPRNAWLLIGSEASYPTPEDLQDQRAQGDAGLFDDEWTAPKNGELGDLVLIYFVAPRKATCFVARLASRPYWQTDVEVAADKAVNPHQWWAATTPFIEIEPIPYKTLQEAVGGYLPLRGRSGHYLSPRTISALKFSAQDPARQAELDQIAQVPVGHPELPAKGDIDFERWKQIPSGLLSIEAKVSEYVVEPLAAILADAPPTRLPNPYKLEREHRVPGGIVDFVFRWGELPPVAAVEVKVAILRPVSGVWSDSPDFLQLRRYMDALEAPGLLVDAHSVLLVKPGADAPSAEIVRSEATWKDVALICDLLAEGFDDKRNSAPMSGGNALSAQAAYGNGEEQLKVFVAFAPVWHFGRDESETVPIVALLAASSEAPAVEASPIIDSPAFRDIAQKFLEVESCRAIAEEHLRGHLLEEHALHTIRVVIPQGSPALSILERVGAEILPPQRAIRRRVSRRG